MNADSLTSAIICSLKSEFEISNKPNADKYQGDQGCKSLHKLIERPAKTTFMIILHDVRKLIGAKTTNCKQYLYYPKIYVRFKEDRMECQFE